MGGKGVVGSAEEIGCVQVIMWLRFQGIMNNQKDLNSVTEVVVLNTIKTYERKKTTLKINCIRNKI